MLKSLSKTAWTIGAGVLLTGIFAGGAYYVEARQIQVLAANVVEDQFDKAGFSLAAARTETYAAGALAGTSTVSYAMLKNALPRLQFRSGEQPLWLWARLVPAADIPALESAVRRETGYEGFAVRGQPPGASFAAPVVFTSDPSRASTLGLDLMSLKSFSEEVGRAAGLRSDANGVADFLAEDGEGALGETTLYVGALVQERSGNAAATNRTLFVKGLTYPDFVKALHISGGQVFELSRILPQGVVLPIFETGKTSGSVMSRTRDLTVGSQVLRLSMSLPDSPARPRNWVIVAIFGLLSTGLIALGQSWVAMGGRAKSLSTALSDTSDALTAVRFKEVAFFENSGTGNCETDFATGRLLRANEALCSLLGYSREEISQKTFQDLTHPGDVKASEEQLLDPPGQPREHMQFERRYVRKDGTPIWCLVNGQLVRDGSGNPAFYAIVIIDISQRKHAETAQSILLAELAHRVRNTVQLTATLARQTASSARSVKEYDNLFHGRLVALKTAQDLLFDTGWKFALLQELAERTLKAFIPPKGEEDRFVIDLPNLELPTQHAQTLGIALNELAVNAAKYGALARNGKVHMKGEIENTAEGRRRLHLKWQESGMTSVRRNRRGGFGTKMLMVAVPEQFQGFAKMKWPKTGLIYEAWLPLDFAAQT